MALVDLSNAFPHHIKHFLSTKYFFIDRTGWEFPKYLEMLKQFDIYKAEEDYINLKLEEPVDFGDFPVTFLCLCVDISKINSILVHLEPTIIGLHKMTSEIIIYYDRIFIMSTHDVISINIP